MIGLIYYIIHTLITLYVWVIIIGSLLTFIPHDRDNQIAVTLDKLSRPPLDFIREKMPFVMFSGIDLSPVVVVIGLQLLDGLIATILFR